MQWPFGLLNMFSNRADDGCGRPIDRQQRTRRRQRTNYRNTTRRIVHSKKKKENKDEQKKRVTTHMATAFSHVYYPSMTDTPCCKRDAYFRIALIRSMPLMLSEINHGSVAPSGVRLSQNVGWSSSLKATTQIRNKLTALHAFPSTKNAEVDNTERWRNGNAAQFKESTSKSILWLQSIRNILMQSCIIIQQPQ